MKRSSVVIALALSLFAHDAAAAAWYLGELSTRALGRGGANVVNPGDPTALWLNPAAITNSTGLQLQLDGAVVFMSSSFTRDCGPRNDCGPIDVERDYGDGRSYVVDKDGRNRPNDDVNGFYPADDKLGGARGTPARFDDGHAVTNQALFQGIPALWATLNLDSFGLDGFALGAAFYAPHAGDYAFGESAQDCIAKGTCAAVNEVTRYTLIDRNLLEVFYGVTAAYRFRNWIAVGASLQGVSAGVDQVVKLSADFKGNENPDSDITLHIHTLQHFIPSANFGAWSSPLPGLELGGSIQLGRQVNATGPVTFLGFGPEVEELIDSGTVTLVTNDPIALSSFELAPFYRLGVKYGLQDLFDGLFGFELELDGVYEDWSSFDHVYLETFGVEMQILDNPPERLKPVVQPKDWMGAWSVRFGGEVGFWRDMLALRSGIYYESDAIPSSTYSVDLMNGQQVGVGVGGSVKFWGVRVDVGYGHVFMFDRVVGDESIVFAETIAVPLLGHDDPRTRVAMGRYTTSYDVVSVALNIGFDEMLGFGVYGAPPEPAVELPPAPVPVPAPAPAPEDEGAAPVDEAPPADETPPPAAPEPEPEVEEPAEPTPV